MRVKEGVPSFGLRSIPAKSKVFLIWVTHTNHTARLGRKDMGLKFITKASEYDLRHGNTENVLMPKQRFRLGSLFKKELYQPTVTRRAMIQKAKEREYI